MLNTSSSLSSYTTSSVTASSPSSTSLQDSTSTPYLKGNEPQDQVHPSSSSINARAESQSPIMNGSHYNLPPIPVMMRHPYIVASVKQYRSDAQTEQLQQHIVSESFIPMAPNLVKPPRKRRRPPFSYSSLIAQAILESEHERMTLRDIYTWITARYPALYNAEDTGWQNTIRHNLSLNRCFKKIPKSDRNGQHRGKGGYWTIDPTYMEKFKNGSFIKGSSSSLRRKTSGGTMSSNTASATTSYSPSSPPPSLPDTPVSIMTPYPSATANNSNGNPYYKHQFLSSINQPHNPNHPIYRHSSSAASNDSRNAMHPVSTTTTAYLHSTESPQQPSEQPCPVMQIHNLLN